MPRLTLEEFKKTLDQNPQHGFSVGDRVTYTNPVGIEFKNLTVTGFSEPIYKNSGVVYLDTSSYWFPVAPETLRKETV